MKKVLALLGTAALLLQSGIAWAEADPTNQITVSAGRENPEIAALCHERLGLTPEQTSTNGTSLALFRQCMVDEQTNRDRVTHQISQNARNEARLAGKMKLSRRSIKLQAKTVQRSLQETIKLRQKYMRGAQTSDDGPLREWLKQDRTNRRLQFKATEDAAAGNMTLRNSIRIYCKGILPNERKDCIREQVEAFNKVQGK